MAHYSLRAPEATPGGIAEPHTVSGVELARNIDDQAEPPAAMVDDEDPVIIAQRTGKSHNAIGRHADGHPAISGKGQSARADAAGIHRGKAVGDRRRGGHARVKWRR